VLTATNTAGCSNTDTVLVQSSEAFTVNVPTGLSACANGQVQLEANVDPFSPVSLVATGLPISIPDNTPSGGLQTNNTLPTVTQLNNSALALGSVTVPAGNYILQGATVSINHTFCGDLDIYLRAPNDQVFVLSTDNGSGNDNYVNITFADNGATVPPANTAIIANTTYLPEGITFGSYTGPINGLWRLYAIDDASADTGTITDFKLNLLEVPTTMTYAWTPSATLNDANLSNPTATVNQPETYTVAVSNVGCTVTSTVDVSVLASPIAAAGNDVSICAGETATLGMTAENGVSYSWASIPSGFNSSTSQITVTPGATTSYVLQATNTATSCTSSDTVTVTVGTQPSASITVVGQTTLCAGDSVLLIANPNYTSYAWSNGTNGTDSLYVSAAGTYSVTLGNSVACSATSAAITIQVVQPTVAIIEADETSLCQGETATLTVTNGTFNNYSWIGTSSNTSTATVNQAGTYSVTTTDAAGCVTTSNEVNIAVNAFTSPNAVASDESICSGTSATLSISNGTYASYTWSNGLGTGATATVSAAGTYSVTVTDANGCSGISNTVSITVLSATSPTITQNGVQLSTSTANAYQWFLDGAAISGATSQTHTATENGTYTVQITDANGCTATSGGIVINTISVEALLTENLHVYPNPFADELLVEYSASEPVSMRIYTATGQLVNEIQQLSSKETILTSTWQAGIYFVEVKQGNTTHTYKLVK
jgi:subtilisin-like proprotein convertase family protein